MILAAGTLWAEGTPGGAFDGVVGSRHNLLPPQIGLTRIDVCMACHTDRAVTEPALQAVPLPLSGAAPRWQEKEIRGTFPVSIPPPIDLPRGPGPSGASTSCLGCHDGAIGPEVHGVERSLEAAKVAVPRSDRPLDHPVSVRYPRSPAGAIVPERPAPNLLRYWSIPDLEAGVIRMPTGPTSAYFSAPSQGETHQLVRTTDGRVQCDSCHDPHAAAHPPFLRADPKDLCLICHDR